MSDQRLLSSDNAHHSSTPTPTSPLINAATRTVAIIKPHAADHRFKIEHRIIIEFVCFTRLSPQLVDSINFVQSESQIKEEYVLSRLALICLQRAHGQSHSLPYHRWFGIILLPFMSFSADGAIAIVYFLCSFLQHFFSVPQPPDLLAEARAIDLSIQFLLFWMPLVTLLGWWLNKPMSMLFGNKNIASFSTGS
jgi:hypothetical protein